MYTVVNSAVTGRMEGGPYLAGFGLGSLSLGIFVISIGSSLSFNVSTLVSQAKGANDPHMCKVYLHRQLFITTMAFPLLMIPVILSNRIFAALG